MTINEREHHIKVLENLLSHYKSREKCERYYDSTLKDSVEALQYAISSLKTDLKYDLMYEREEIYTKDDMRAILTELLLAIQNLDTPPKYKDEDYFLFGTGACQDIIQNKINEL